MPCTLARVPVLTVVALLTAFAVPGDAAAWSPVSGLEGAPVEVLAARTGPDGAVCAVAAGLAGAYLTRDGGLSWTRHRAWRPEELGCAFMDATTTPDAAIVRCRRGPEAELGCWRLGWDGRAVADCRAGELAQLPLPEAAPSASVPTVSVGDLRLRAGAIWGLERSADAGASWQPANRGLDGLAVVWLERGEGKTVRASLAVPRAGPLIREGSPWVRAGEASCRPDASEWRCVITGPQPTRPIPSRHESVPASILRWVPGDPPTPTLAIWPLSAPEQATLAGSSRGLSQR